MKKTITTLSDLSPGDVAIIDGFTDKTLSLKLMEMGFLPDTKIVVDREAPLGCPVCVTVGGDYQVSLRKSEAATVLVKILEEV